MSELINEIKKEMRETAIMVNTIIIAVLIVVVCTTIVGAFFLFNKNWIVGSIFCAPFILSFFIILSGLIVI